MTAVLEVSDLSKSFGGITAVDGVSFDVRQGEILGIIGPNGSGKSTLFNCVLGQYQPNASEIRIDGTVTTIISFLPVRSTRGQCSRACSARAMPGSARMPIA